MTVWSEVRRGLEIVLIGTVLYTGWVVASRYVGRRRETPPKTAPVQGQVQAQGAFDQVYGGTAVRILQFYAREATVTEGGQSVICYGVLNARSVKVEPPPADGVFPALSRCVAVQPEHDTRYTLTAVGQDGQTASESLDLAVRPDSVTLPKITSFEIVDHKVDYRGRTVYLLSFGAENAETVDIDPPAFPTLHGAPSGRFYVSPEKTTTYTLTVTGKHGHKTQRHLTVAVPQS